MQEKIKIEDWMKLVQTERQRHIDLTTECEYHTYIKDYKKKKVGDLYAPSKQMAVAKQSLLEYLNIEYFNGRDIHLCHKCINNSGSNNICINPLHTYFGSAKENQFDIPDDIRKLTASKGGKVAGKSTYEKGTGLFSMTEQEKYEAGSKGGKKTAENGTGAFQQKIECPHCGKIGRLAIMKRWHFDKCKKFK
jgi:hypothetical protein